MIVFDFLIYNLTKWYTARPKQLQWSTPLERAIYVAAMMTILWLSDFGVFFNIHILKKDDFPRATIIIFVVTGMSILLLFNYIYIKRGRFERINQASTKPFNASDKVGQTLSICLLFLPLLILGLTLFLG